MNEVKSVILLIIWVTSFLLGIINLPQTQISFLDVGQGDCILIKTNKGKYILIDGGPDLNSIYQVGKNMKSVSEFSLVVLTHPHADHINGFWYLSNRFEFENILINDVHYENAVWDSFKQKCEKMECKNLGEKRELSIEIDGLNIDLWAPNCEGWVRNVNNCSIITLVKYDDYDFLLMGDAEQEEEELFIEEYGSKLKDIEVLKAGHHCSRTASDEKFVEYINPEIAICSVGVDNQFKHPHEETIELFNKYNIKILRTDYLGSIIFNISKTGSISIFTDRTYQL